MQQNKEDIIKAIRATELVIVSLNSYLKHIKQVLSMFSWLSISLSIIIPLRKGGPSAINSLDIWLKSEAIYPEKTIARIDIDESISIEKNIWKTKIFIFWACFFPWSFENWIPKYISIPYKKAKEIIQ